MPEFATEVTSATESIDATASEPRVSPMYIAGIGTAVPAHGIAQEEAARVATSMYAYDDAQKKRIEKLYRLTKVDYRHSVILKSSADGSVTQDFFKPGLGESAENGPSLGARMRHYESDAAPLAVEAVQVALMNSGRPASSITHLITVSCSGFSAPGVDIALIKALELPATVERTHVGFMGCHGALNGIRVARGIVGTNPDAQVLLVAVELCSLHYQFSLEDETNLANGLFSDGAAAMVLSAKTQSKLPAWRCAATGACLLPDSESAMTWKVRDHGFQMTLSREVPVLIKANLRTWLTTWLAKNDLTPEDIESWAIHPGGPAILLGVQSALDLAREDLAPSWSVLRDHGNMSSPTVLFVIEQMRQAKAALPCVSLGFGPGLAIEATLWT